MEVSNGSNGTGIKTEFSWRMDSYKMRWHTGGPKRIKNRVENSRKDNDQRRDFH